MIEKDFLRREKDFLKTYINEYLPKDVKKPQSSLRIMVLEALARLDTAENLGKIASELALIREILQRRR